MWTGHRKEIQKLWPVHIINSVDETKLSCNTPTTQHHSFFRNLPPLLESITYFIYEDFPSAFPKTP